MVWPHHQGYLVAGIWQVQEYDDARILAFSCEHQLTKVNALLRQPESQQRHWTKRFNRVELRTLRSSWANWQQKKKTWPVEEYQRCQILELTPNNRGFTRVYTMKKFKIKEPTAIMRIEKRRGEMTESTHQNWSIHPKRQYWNDKVPKGGKNTIDVLLESEPHWVDDPIKGSTIV